MSEEMRSAQPGNRRRPGAEEIPEGTGGHGWEVGLELEVQTHTDTSVNLEPRSFELASARGSPCSSPSDRRGAQEPSHVGNSRGKGWDVPGAAAVLTP